MANITRILAVSLIVLAVLLGIFAWCSRVVLQCRHRKSSRARRAFRCRRHT